MADINQTLFTLTLVVRTHVVGPVPGGNKIDLEYVPERSSVTGGRKPGLDDGRVVSGQDWVTINDNGVADFSGRLTLGFGDILVGAHLNGRADLAMASAPSRTTQQTGAQTASQLLTNLGSQAYQSWKSGFASNSTLKIAIAITFEVAEGDATKIQGLDRAVYLGIGTVTFENKPFSPMEKIVLDVREIALG